ncbi:MAG: hypothetical protein OEV44_00305 [Spirochaetota bacterium]|nr:hypothetical protein [Spirochaetota bacterium]
MIKRIGKGFELNKSKQKFDAVKLTAPKIIANNSLNWFLEGFRKGGYKTDASKNGWQTRKPRKNESGNQRATLIKTGALRRDFQIIKAEFGKIILGTKNIPYAVRHNEGITDRLGRKMPKREFAGQSKELNIENEKLLEKLLNNVMK